MRMDMFWKTSASSRSLIDSDIDTLRLKHFLNEFNSVFDELPEGFPAFLVVLQNI